MADELGVNLHHLVDDLPAALLGHLDLLVHLIATSCLLQGLPGGADQDESEDHADPLEPLEQLEAAQDEDESKEDGSGDAVVQHATFEGPIHLETGEDQAHDEQVVEAESLLESPGCQVLAGGLVADEDEHRDGERQREADVEHRPAHRLGELDDVVLLGVVGLDDRVPDEDHDHRCVHEPWDVERVDVGVTRRSEHRG